ncbi:uncharacterized protein SCHCODRAFT_02631400 [Schizophyllum commune H4-8]|uniref:uncharacterized protein n=1 Tax=Schizophyllum commune (strain H4-8 / FGSC 9210) TaxID=578458 RepID=UPI002160DA19|nr:uncharacterized protein SCHCODRAFT_02631400 [Schizophyllum commune H4-8]KAI5890285.1 hypothetical protein SCHCODRAFT_02631400 [Schizophyllum commune H4-8]
MSRNPEEEKASPSPASVSLLCGAFTCAAGPLLALRSTAPEPGKRRRNLAYENGRTQSMR